MPVTLRRPALRAALAALVLGACPSGPGRAQEPFTGVPAPARTPDVAYVPTPEPVVEVMMDLVRVGPGDVVYDLGCGDGRLVIAAARRGARKAVGVDIDPERILEARDNARRAGVADRVRFVEGDLFELDFSDASVVTLFLAPELNQRLRPKLLALAPGTRVVSYVHDMGDWKPDEVRTVGKKAIHAWTVPERRAPEAGRGR